MRSLDDPTIYKQVDPSGMGGRIAALPQQCRDAWVKALAFPLPDSYRQVERVLVLGMGGSAIGGDLLAGLHAMAGELPVEVHRGYGGRNPVDERTLVIVSSYSGNTEETLDAFEFAWKPGVKALACTTGGALANLCYVKGVPVFPIECDGEARSAVGYGLFSILGFIQRLGLASDRSKDVAEAIGDMNDLAREIAPEVPESRNPAKQLATTALGKIVVVYAAQHLAAVARRWKTQIAENAKTWAFFEHMPEINHNSVEGLRFPQGAIDDFLIVMLRSGLYHQRITARDLTGELLQEEGVRYTALDARGKGPLGQTMTSILFGDYVSYYLAVLNGVDPSPSPNLDRLKSRLSKL